MSEPQLRKAVNGRWPGARPESIEEGVMTVRGMTRLAVFGAMLASGAAVRANVDLEWRPSVQVVRPGDLVQIGLYAVSSDGVTTWDVSAMDVLLQWDATTMALIGVNDNGPYTWFRSEFPDDSALDGLNNTWTDGDAKYTALGQFQNPAQATPAGLLVTTFKFDALQGTVGNQLTIPPTLGQYSRTVVFGVAFPGHEITGALGDALVSICPGAADGDMNGDGSLNGDDLSGFIQAVMTASVAPADVCPGDFTGDGAVDTDDVPQMVSALLSP